MKNKKNNQLKASNGITLIALVITIIVLLILAGVTIAALSGTNGILSNANKAKEQTTESGAKEKINIAIGGSYNSTGDFDSERFKEEILNLGGTIEEETEEIIRVNMDGYESIVNKEDGKIQEVVDRAGINVGDYVNYTPDVNTETYNISDEMSGYSSWNGQNLKQYNYPWRVLKKYSDGSIKLISSPAVADRELHLKGVAGYSNGVTILNEIAEKFGSRGDIKARSINFEDIEECLTDKGKEQRDNYSSYSGGPLYGHTQTYINGEKGYPNLYEQEIGGKIDSGKEGLSDGIDKENVNKSGLNRSDEGMATGYSEANTSLTVTQTCTFIEINEENFGEAYQVIKLEHPGYWVASRSVNCLENHIEFGLFGVISQEFSGKRDNGWGFCTNENLGATNYGGFAVPRAVVVLDPQTEITISDDATNPDTPHIITKY